MNQNTKYVDPWRTNEDLAMNPAPTGGACVSVTHMKAHRRTTPWTLHRQVGPAWDGGSRMSGTKGVSLLDGNKTITPLSPPNRPITSINTQATLHLHRQLLYLLLASCPCSTAVDRRHGPQGEAKGKHPVGKLPSSLLVIGKLLAKKTLLLILIVEIDLDFVFLISVHSML